ncbi:tryptophan 2,3-dioxygenase family protein, partial [Nitrosomonas sp. ANs5]|uniref:tryptophan 2,3-dioxygenase family protein n=1 Tax=Nitrosomonas sp. ANs5 TaxID=3423941 RepID=UPI003D357658
MLIQIVATATECKGAFYAPRSVEIPIGQFVQVRVCMKIHPPLYYRDYLQLPKILNAQAPESAKYGNEVHDETLFIVIHQTYPIFRAYSKSISYDRLRFKINNQLF